MASPYTLARCFTGVYVLKETAYSSGSYRHRVAYEMYRSARVLVFRVSVGGSPSGRKFLRCRIEFRKTRTVIGYIEHLYYADDGEFAGEAASY